MLAMFGGFTVLIIVGAWIFLMTQKKGWRWTQLLAGMLLMSVLYGNFPSLPANVNNAVHSIAKTFNLE